MLSASLCPDIDAQVRLGLLVLALQNVKLRHVAVNAGDAVADVERRSLCRLEPDRGHSKIRVVGVVGVGHQIVGSIVSCAMLLTALATKGRNTPASGVSLKQISAFWITLLEVVRQVHSKQFARRERRGQSVVLVLAHELGLRVGVGLLQNVDGSAQGRPRARRIDRLEAVTAFLAWRRADEHAVEKKGRTRKSSPETCTSEYE